MSFENCYISVSKILSCNKTPEFVSPNPHEFHMSSPLNQDMKQEEEKYNWSRSC